MQKTIQATYEGGVLRPLEPLLLRERQKVMVTVFDDVDLSLDQSVFVSPDEWADAAREEISLEDLRSHLASIQGSLSQTVIDERRER